MNPSKTGRLALVAITAGFLAGVALLNGGSAQSIGGLCNGRPASHTWLDASGQYGPSLLDGTDDDDIIIGSDGDDHIDAGDGDDVVCGATGHNHIHGGPGDDALLGGPDGDDLDGSEGNDTVVGFGGDDTVQGGTGRDFLVGGSGDDVLISVDRGHSHGGGGHAEEGGHEHESDHDHDGDHVHDGPPTFDNEIDKVNAGDGFDVCLFGAGDELANCEY
jgi:Ca2+-binding RTX toxin-like protein